MILVEVYAIAYGGTAINGFPFWSLVIFARVSSCLIFTPADSSDFPLKLTDNALEFSSLITLLSQLLVKFLHNCNHIVLVLFEFFLFLFVLGMLLMEHLNDGGHLCNFLLVVR